MHRRATILRKGLEDIEEEEKSQGHAIKYRLST